MIEVKHLTKKYGANIAVSDLNFTIEQGKIYGFLGPNGAGKSTTMNMITGCLSPTEGQILIDGIDIQDDAVRAKKLIGYLPETPPVYPDMTPEEYLIFVAEAKGVKRRDIIDAVSGAMEETGLFPMKDRLIKNLSKGYKQRVGIAQAMLGDPQVIILDEPTVGLDPKQITDIRELIKRLGETKTVILSSHILAEVSAVCDQVMIINGGRLIASDTLENIRKENSPENRFSLTAKGETAQISALLSQYGKILSVSTGDNGLVYAELEAESDPREALFFAFAKRSIPLLELKKVTPSLEEIFLSLTSSSYAEEEYDDGDYDDGEEYDDEEYDDDDEEDEDDDEDEDDGGYKPLFS